MSCITNAADDHEDDNKDCDDKDDDCDDNYLHSTLCVTNAASEEMIMIRMMSVMIRMRTVLITVIVASSALPMLPNATTEMYIVMPHKR